ncbi:hypothetical protein DYQ95_01995 [Xanthomonas sp. LMG 9002]|nr:hypothetical protein [Xanthomonas sp. LMG 9002]
MQPVVGRQTFKRTLCTYDMPEAWLRVLTLTAAEQLRPELLACRHNTPPPKPQVAWDFLLAGPTRPGSN